MQIEKAKVLNPFGGINLVLEEFEKMGLDVLLREHMPQLPAQCTYSWKDIFYSFCSIYLCGGEVIEDLGQNMKSFFKDVPYLKVPSPDRVLARFKELAEPSFDCRVPRGKVEHEFSTNDAMSRFLISVHKRCMAKDATNVLDYDNTITYTEKQDARRTYKKEYGYVPGVAVMGSQVVYLENRNGNSDPKTMQKETLERMFGLLGEQGIKVEAFRADSASWQLEVVNTARKHVDRFYIAARGSQKIAEAIRDISLWTLVEHNGKPAWRGEVVFTPFRSVKKPKDKGGLHPCRLIVTRKPRKDGQMDIFTQDAAEYLLLATNDMDMASDDVVAFYHQRGAMEKEFDVLKNDFGWSKMPFSKLEQNTVFLILTAACRNLYDHLIRLFAHKSKWLEPHYRVKKFIFRFISIPSKWVSKARRRVLKLFGDIGFGP